MEDKRQMRYTDEELNVLKTTFAQNDSLLKAIRKVMLQAKLDQMDIHTLLPVSENPAVLEVLTKTFAPEIDVTAPLGQIIDLWMTVDGSEKTPEAVVMALRVRDRLKTLISKGLQRLEQPKPNPTEKIVSYEPDFKKDAEDVYITFTARNALITHIEFQLNQIRILAGSKEETVEETRERLLKDSTK